MRGPLREFLAKPEGSKVRAMCKILTKLNPLREHRPRFSAHQFWELSSSLLRVRDGQGCKAMVRDGDRG